MFTIKPFYLKSNYGNRERKRIVRLEIACAIPKTILRYERKKFCPYNSLPAPCFKKLRKFF